MQTHASSEKSKNTSAVAMHNNKPQPFFAPVFIQPKLTIGHVDDPYEKEADAVADQVMRMPDKVGQKQTFFTPVVSTVQRKCKEFEEEEKLQMKAVNNTNAGTIAPPVVHDVINSGGAQLDADTRSFMESRFGYDFGNVKIHNDSLAHQSSKDINAFAYTHRNHVVFAANQYQPHTNRGKELLAHELTHVVQQANNTSSQLQKKGKPDESKPSIDKKNQSAGEVLLSDYYSQLNSALDKSTYKNLEKVFDRYNDAVKILARIAMVSSGSQRYREIGELYTPGIDDVEENRALRYKRYVLKNSMLEIPSEKLFAPEDLLIDENTKPELFGFKEYFIKHPITIVCHPERAELYPERAIEYFWQGQLLTLDYHYKAGKLLLDKLAGWVQFKSLPVNELLTSGLDTIKVAFTEHVSGYTTALDNLEVMGMSVATQVIETDWQILLHSDHEITKLKYVYGNEAVNASIKLVNQKEDFINVLKTSFGLVKFQEQSVYQGNVENENLNDPETGISYEIIEALKVVASLNKLIQILKKPKLSFLDYTNLSALFFAESGRPINTLFKKVVLEKLNLWHTMELYYSFEETFKINNQNIELFGPYINVGNFDLDEIVKLLDTGITDWMVTGKEAGKVLEMMVNASPKGREKILWKLMEKNLDWDFLSSLPYKQVEALANSITDPTLKRILALYYENKGGGESAAAMLDRKGTEHATEGNYVRAYGYAFLHTAWNAFTGGFLNTYSQAYDLREAGLLSGNDLNMIAAKAAFRTAAVLAVSTFTGGATTGLTTGALTRAGLAEGTAGVFGNIAGGIGGGLSDQFTSDVISIALLDQKGFSPGLSYLMAAGIGGGVAGIGSIGSKFAPESAARMGEIYNERHPWLTKLIAKSQNVFSPKENAPVNGLLTEGSTTAAYGTLPEGAKILTASTDYVIYENPSGELRIRFKAASAVTLKEANPARTMTTEERAGLNEEGEPYVHEGRHRAIGAAKGDKIPTDLGGVDDAPGWLDFEFNSEVAKGGVSVKDLTIDYSEPDVSREEADAIWEERHGGKFLKPEDATGDGYLTPAEVAELQAIANRFKTKLYVVGSRAKGQGRNITRTDLPVGKDDISTGAITRSDIDVRIDSDVDVQTSGMLSDAIANVSKGTGMEKTGAGKSMNLIGNTVTPPAIVFTPK